VTRRELAPFAAGTAASPQGWFGTQPRKLKAERRGEVWAAGPLHDVELASSDWGDAGHAPRLEKSVEEGGWSIYTVDSVGADMIDPSVNNGLQVIGTASSWFRWPTDDQLEGLRTEWLRLTRRDFDKDGGQNGTAGYFFSEELAGSGEDRFSPAACQRYAVGGTLRRQGGDTRVYFGGAPSPGGGGAPRSTIARSFEPVGHLLYQ
jgi:hypothetical protein